MYQIQSEGMPRDKLQRLRNLRQPAEQRPQHGPCQQRVNRCVRPQTHFIGSYTCYLFEKGIDKILKKVGEECAETIIAAKNGDKAELVGEINDVFYHMMVMMNECGVTMEDVCKEMDIRAQKIGNLKKFHVSDHNT